MEAVLKRNTLYQVKTDHTTRLIGLTAELGPTGERSYKSHFYRNGSLLMCLDWEVLAFSWRIQFLDLSNGGRFYVNLKTNATTLKTFTHDINFVEID